MNATPVPKLAPAALLTIVLAFALAAGATAGAAPDAQGGEITPGKSVGPITIGMPLEELLRVWGRPEQTERGQDGLDRSDYTDRGVLVFLKEDRVVQLIVLSPAWSTTSGAKVGMRWPEVRAFLGQPNETQQGPTQDEPRYWYTERGIAFILKGRTVAAIAVVAPIHESGSKGLLDDLLKGGTKRERGDRGR
jgi:hypothetical protein